MKRLAVILACLIAALSLGCGRVSPDRDYVPASGFTRSPSPRPAVTHR